ncbi:hypothetical protein NL676_036185 [Syzygium grande]|nr:hypothetical protein NL676_036185 [Syzygium grande]
MIARLSDYYFGFLERRLSDFISRSRRALMAGEPESGESGYRIRGGLNDQSARAALPCANRHAWTQPHQLRSKSTDARAALLVASIDRERRPLQAMQMRREGTSLRLPFLDGSDVPVSPPPTQQPVEVKQLLPTYRRFLSSETARAFLFAGSTFPGSVALSLAELSGRRMQSIILVS